MNAVGFQVWSGKIAAILSLPGLLAGCGSKVQRVTDEVFEQTYKIDLSASLRLRNAAGSVSIHGADAAELRLRAIKKARSSAQLNSIGINVAAQTSGVSITTNFLREKNKALSIGTGTVDYTLTVPRTAKIARLELDDGKVLIEGIRGEEVRASVADGQLAMRNCFANAHLFVANGVLDFFYDHVDGQRFSVDAQVTNGNARIFVPRGASLHVRAETTTGKIVNEFANVELNGGEQRKIDWSVGKAVRSEINLRITSGDIKISEAKPDMKLPEQGASK